MLSAFNCGFSCFVFTLVYFPIWVCQWSQIITGHVLRTVVEHMNILSVLYDLQCLVFTITIQERVPWWVKPCFHSEQRHAWVEITQDFSISSLKKLIISFVWSFFTAYWMSCITSWVVSSLSLLDFPFFTDLLGTNSSAWSSTCQQYCHKENFQGYMEVMMKILMAPKHVLVGMSPLFSRRQTRH